MLPSYSKKTDTKNTIEIPIDAMKVIYEQQLVNKINEKLVLKMNFQLLKEHYKYTR